MKSTDDLLQSLIAKGFTPEQIQEAISRELERRDRQQVPDLDPIDAISQKLDKLQESVDAIAAELDKD